MPVGLVKIQTLRKKLRKVRVTHPRLQGLRQAVTRYGIGITDEDGDLCVTERVAAKLEQHYNELGVFGPRRDALTELTQS
jgi:hypothetical protein